MKRTSIALSVLFFALTATARADSSPYQSFFSSLEGHWAGTGVISQLGADGSQQQMNYEIQIETSRADQQGTWTVMNQFTGENGMTTQNAAAYTVRDDLLLVSSSGATEPVQVTEISPLDLTYLTQRTDALSGQSYTFTFHAELDSAGDTLTGHNTTQTNGVTIQDETFTAKRW